MQYPTVCDTTRKKIEFIFRMIELLRKVHNSMGLWYRQPITQTQYNNQLGQLPTKIANWISTNYPYKSQLTQSDWDEFIAIFRAKTHILMSQREIHVGDLKIVITWDNDADLDDVT